MGRLIPIVILAAVVGCGDSGPATVLVTGTVTQDGEPVEGALVVFTPSAPGETSQLAAQAETDATGTFTLSTYVSGDDYKSGIQPGAYVVTVIKLEVVQDMKRQPRHLLPKKYSQPATSGLTATVKEQGENVFAFEL